MLETALMIGGVVFYVLLVAVIVGAIVYAVKERGEYERRFYRLREKASYALRTLEHSTRRFSDDPKYANDLAALGMKRLRDAVTEREEQEVSENENV